MWTVTPFGRTAWETRDTSIPADYRRLLWLIDVQGDLLAIQELLRQHPDRLVRDWLRELEQLGCIRPGAKSTDIDRTIPLHLSDVALAVGARARGILSSAGAYLADNPKARARPSKRREETTVLIVDDDPDQLALADLRVTLAGYQVRAAASVQALTRSLLEQGAPDLLLLDVMLPDGDGFNVLEKLRRHPDFSTLPIVMLTAKQDVADIAKGLALGADGYVTKPYSKNILVGVVAGVLD
jgi:CheY-like chemotaxis protein